MRKCVVTPEGTEYIDLTAEEQAARAEEEALHNDPAIEEARREAQAAQLLNRAIDLTFLDGFWVLFKKAAPVGVAAIDNAVAADDRAAFNAYFKDRVKTRL